MAEGTEIRVPLLSGPTQEQQEEQPRLKPVVSGEPSCDIGARVACHRPPKLCSYAAPRHRRTRRQHLH
jgi:hypothetical protein